MAIISALGIFLVVTALPAGADEWWRQDTRNPWSADGDRDAPWGETQGEAWWLEPSETSEWWQGEEDRWREDRAPRNPWAEAPAESGQGGEPRTYDPWTDWTERPWGNLDGRERTRDSRKKGDDARREAPGSWGPGPPYPYYPGGALPGYPTPPVLPPPW